MSIIPIHNLEVKNLKRGDFDIIKLTGEKDKDYDGVIPHRHNFYELLIFTKGGGKHEIDFKVFEIEECSIHFVSPTQVHKLKSAAARGFVFCFKEDFLQLNTGNSFAATFPFYDFNTYSPIIKMDKKAFKEIEDVVEILSINYNKDSVLKSEIIKAYLNILLIKIKEYFINNAIFTSNQIASTNPKIQEFKRLVNANYQNHYSVFKYAEMLNISANYLNALCKKETGKTSTELLHERLVLEAKRLLYSTRRSIKEIAGILNFDSDAYFVRFFKKNTGQTPLDYRNNS